MKGDCNTNINALKFDSVLRPWGKDVKNNTSEEKGKKMHRRQ